MKLEVPFFKQTDQLNCGTYALKMVLAFLGEDLGIGVLDERAGVKEGKGSYTIQIAIATTSLGHRTCFYSKNISFNEENFKLDFYKKYSPLDLQQSQQLIEKGKAAGIHIQQRTLSLEELLSFVSEDSIPIVLIDWNVIRNRRERGYHGHFVPIVGFDEQNVYMHNHGLNDPQEFMQVKKEILDKARREQGTDEDVVIIYRK